MKIKQILVIVGLLLFPVFLSAQFSSKLELPEWSKIPTGIYKLRVEGNIRVRIEISKENYYDFGTDIRDYISSGQELPASNFCSNGTLTISSEITGTPSVLRIHTSEPLVEIEVLDGGLVIIDSRLRQPSMTVKLNNGKIFSEQKLSIDNFVLENHDGIVDLKKAYLESAILNISQESKNTIEGRVSKQKIYVIKK